MSKTIVVHGASGFLGKHLVQRLLKNGHTVLALARETSKLEFSDSDGRFSVQRYRQNLSELKGSISRLNPAVYYELAWQGVFGEERNNADQLTVNVSMFEESVQLADALGAGHWVGLGSQAEYGNLDKKISESDECHPTNLYGKAKLKCSQMTQELCEQFGIEYTWIRLFSAYGPDDSHDWLIPFLIKRMINGEDIQTTEAQQNWDYLYINDLVDALAKLVDSNGLGIVNLGSGKPVKIKAIIEKIQQLTGSHSKIHYGAVAYRDDQIMHLEADISRISKALDWSPKTDLDAGLSKTIEYYQELIKK